MTTLIKDDWMYQVQEKPLTVQVYLYEFQEDGSLVTLSMNTFNIDTRNNRFDLTLTEHYLIISV